MNVDSFQSSLDDDGSWGKTSDHSMITIDELRVPITHLDGVCRNTWRVRTSISPSPCQETAVIMGLYLCKEWHDFGRRDICWQTTHNGPKIRNSEILWRRRWKNHGFLVRAHSSTERHGWWPKFDRSSVNQWFRRSIAWPECLYLRWWPLVP